MNKLFTAETSSGIYYMNTFGFDVVRTYIHNSENDTGIVLLSMYGGINNSLSHHMLVYFDKEFYHTRVIDESEVSMFHVGLAFKNCQKDNFLDDYTDKFSYWQDVLYNLILECPKIKHFYVRKNNYKLVTVESQDFRDTNVRCSRGWKFNEMLKIRGMLGISDIKEAFYTDYTWNNLHILHEGKYRKVVWNDEYYRGL